MNIFNKVTLQSLKKSRTRTIVTIIGVALSAAMITAVATFTVTLQSYLVNSSVQRYGSWQVAFLDVDAAFMQERSQDDGVTSATTLENIGYAPLTDYKNPDKPYLFITGFNPKAFESLPITLLSGRLPQNSGEVLVPAHLAANGGVTYTLITTTDPANQSDCFNLFVTLKNPYDVHHYTKDTAGTYNTLFNDNVLRFMGLSDDTLFNTLLYSVGSVLVSLIMLGSIFLIYNAFNISLNERTRQFGILASVGATAKQLRNSVLFEGLCIGAVGIPLGVFLGLASISLVISLIAKNFENILLTDVPLTLSISAPTLMIAVAVSMMTILISAYIPARKAASRPVLESIRQTKEIKIESGAVKTSKLAQRLYSLEGTLALKNFKRNKKRYGSIVLSLTLSVVLFVSAGAFGTNLKQIAKASVVNADFDISFISVNRADAEVFKIYDKLKTADGVYNSSYQGLSTYWVTVNASDLSDRYREAAGLTASDQAVHLPLDIQFIEDSLYLDFLNTLGLSPADYTDQNPKMTAVAKAKGPNDHDNGAEKASLYNLFANPSLNVTITPEADEQQAPTQSKNISLTFVDTIPIDVIPRQFSETQNDTNTFMVVAPYGQKATFDIQGTNEVLGLTFKSETPAQSVAKMKTILLDEGITSDYTLYNLQEIFEQNRNIVFVVDVFTYVFVLMISLIATANVFNTISTNIGLRRREFAMLRSVGMSDRNFNKMMNFECAFFGLRTLLYGIPMASILSWLIYKGLVAGGGEIQFAFPWASLAISIIGVFLLVFTTMLYATRKIKKENIIDALRDDMT